MKQTGIVFELNDNKAKIIVTRLAACGSSCESCSAHCGENKQEYINVKNDIGLKIGDRVEITTDSKAVLKYIALVYGLPLIFLISGVVIGMLLNLKEMYSLLVGFVFMIVSFIFIKTIDNKNGSNHGIIIKKL
ncbi:MAG: SoxR reducing system RseC family protein [Peptoniphilus duerdenii]|uniref:SoxR reducing system RseC family protein n=1 Tax=Peptoniphilus duerdenii TaxID=507750 RepID=UPI00254B7399|nr:SoxR reducing system RseC family protein [Peptoniphilus duerdenii]MDK8275918.1 SoxR reducing system RseC family protein [Peptoniphilus duerdenii]